MYDVIFIDAQGQETPLAHLLDRTDAASLACREAAQRGAGRMVLPGSTRRPANCVCVVPVPLPEAA
jgi:hypothetical protein